MFFFGCHKNFETDTELTSIPTNIKEILKTEGFSTYNLINVDSGYVVEGDIFLPNSYFEAKSQPDIQSVNNPMPAMSTENSDKFQKKVFLENSNKTIKIGPRSQYRTTNLVAAYLSPGVSLNRVIKLKAGSPFPTIYITAIDSAIARYNQLNLAYKFSRVTTGQDINIINEDLGAGNLGKSGFPSNGNPYNTIRLNVNFIGNSPNLGFLTSIITHEMGHTIGLRHTDYFNRSYSCGYSNNENASPDGAIQIPGTNPNEDPNSFMLACSNGTDRPFTENDITALRYIYGKYSTGSDGKFYRNPTTGAVYVLMEGKARWINSLDALVALFGSYWNIEPYFIDAPIGLNIGDQLLAGSKLIKSATSNTLYFLDVNPVNTVKRLVDSSLLTTYQLKYSNIQIVSSSILAGYPTGTALTGGGNEGQTIRDGSTGAIYTVLNNNLRWITDGNVYDNTFSIYFNSIPNVLSLTDLGKNISLGSKLIKSSTSGTYFVDVSSGNVNTLNTSYKRLIPTTDIFNRYDFSINSIQTVTTSVLNSYINGPQLW